MGFITIHQWVIKCNMIFVSHLIKNSSCSGDRTSSASCSTYSNQRELYNVATSQSASGPPHWRSIATLYFILSTSVLFLRITFPRGSFYWLRFFWRFSSPIKELSENLGGYCPLRHMKTTITTTTKT